MKAACSWMPPRNGGEQLYRREETIFRQGERVHFWYEVVRGMVRICHFHSDGRRQVVAFAVPGEVLGVEVGTRDAAAEALNVVELRRHDFLDGGEPPWERVLRAAQQVHGLMGYPTALGRVSAFLVSMMVRLGGNPTFELPMPRVDIADHLCLTMHTVSRTISDLARRKLIELPGQHIFVIPDPGALAAHAGIDAAELMER